MQFHSLRAGLLCLMLLPQSQLVELPALPDITVIPSLNLVITYTFNVYSLVIYSVDTEHLHCTGHTAIHGRHKDIEIEIKQVKSNLQLQNIYLKTESSNPWTL